jgi:hypothetical protein
MILSLISMAILSALQIGAPSSEMGLAFYLVNNSEKSNKLNNLEVDKVPFFTQKEIISFSKSQQSMILTEDALVRLKKVGVGRSFVACVNGKPIYFGKIWSPLRSASCPEIVLMVSPGNDAQVRLLAGYPTSSYFTGSDQRFNKAILDVLRGAGKLRE